MTIETRPGAQPAPELDAEQEVDFGRYWRAIAARWWLPLAGLVAGLLIGYLVSLGTSSTSYKATAQVYLGQPLAPGGGASVSTTPTILGLVTSFMTAESTVRRVAARVGLKPRRLRGRIQTKPILGITGARLGAPAPLLEITVTGASPAKAAAAANALAEMAVDQSSTYADVKIQVLKDQVAFTEKELANVDRRLDVALRQQQQALTNTALGTAERLIALVNFNSLVNFLDQRRASLERDRIDRRQTLALAEDIERGRVVTPALAERSAGPSSRTGAAIGGLIGLILGVLAALFWDPLAARARARPA